VALVPQGSSGEQQEEPVYPAGLPPFIQNWRIIEGGGLFMKRIAQGILGFLILLASTALAQPGQSTWRPFGPGGGSVSSLAVDPRDSSVLYAATGSVYSAVGFVYKSTDGGMTWQALAGVGFQAVAVDPDHPETVLAGGFVMMRSTDGGRTWQEVLPRRLNLDQGIRVLTTAPGGLAFAGTYARLLRSTDGGASWSEVLRGLLDVRSIQVDPDDPSRVYAVTREALYVSTDSGAHWQRGVRPGTGTIFRLALSPSDPGTLFASVEGSPNTRIFRSDDGAATWRLVEELPVGRPAEEVLLVDPRSSSTVYAGGTGGIFGSFDGGETWTDSSLGLPRPDHAPMGIFSLAVAPSRPEALFAGTIGWGVARRTGAGDRWRIGVEPGLTASAVSMLDFHPQRPGTVYLGIGSGVYGAGGSRSFRSTDSGRTWQPFGRSMSQDGLNDLAFDPADPDLLYAATPTGTWKSADAGETWERVSEEGGRYIAFVGRGALLSSRCGMKRSTDGGRTWQEVIPCVDEEGDPREPRSFFVDPKGLQTVYVRFYVSNGASRQGSEAFKSRDGGLTWTALRTPGGSSLFAVAPSDFRILYALSLLPGQKSLWRSMDGGETWKVVNRRLDAQISSLDGAFEVDGGNPDKLYLGALNGIWVSRNGGKSLKLFKAPLEEGKRDTFRLWTDRTQPGRIFASPSTGGLFVGRFE
jgi:photosystem II stability/assembly factor-like uncharacterized protein